MRCKKLYADVKWEMYDKEGNSKTMTGCWLVGDNGFPDYPFIQAPPTVGTKKDVVWGKMVESMRKGLCVLLATFTFKTNTKRDIEMVFGKLKNRFRILRYGLRVRKVKDVEAVFNKCCVLHNYLHLLREPDVYKASLGQVVWPSYSYTNPG